MTPPDPRLAALRALAELATKGPWKASASGVITDYGDGGYWAICLPVRPPIGAPEHADNMAFIAAANPAVVLSLLDALAAAEGEREKLDALCQKHDCVTVTECGGFLGNWMLALLRARRETIAERDALAARLAGAERVVKAARGFYAAENTVDQELYYNLIGNALRDLPSEAGGEGRGTV